MHSKCTKGVNFSSDFTVLVALTREVNLDTQSSDSSAEEMRDSGKTFQSLIV